MRTFDEFFDEHYDEVVRTLALAVGDRARAEDAAQEAFAKAYRKWTHVAALDRPVGWVVVVGVNQMKRWITRVDRRDRQREERLVAAGAAGAAAWHDHADAITDASALRAALDTLAPRQRATVVLRYLCDLSTDECARALGCSPGTVKSALSAALANLRVELDGPDARGPDAGPDPGPDGGPAHDRSTTAPRKEGNRHAAR